MKLSARRKILLDVAILYVFAAALVWPYFREKYTDKWPSIESTFISDARFLVSHWPHPQWQPLWYTGTRFDYIYPPALRYGTAIISKITGFWPVKAYHFYISMFYSMGFAGVYLLMRAAGRSRGAAYLAAIATALMSPSLLFMKDMRIDSGPFVPVRLGALLRYGEGPHITALSLMPFALAFTWRALETRRPGWVVLAAVFCAAVVSNNFYGATALTMFYAILLWSFWITHQDKRMAAQALGIPALAYGLTAFWLVPSYLQITTRNMEYVSQSGNWWSAWATLVMGVSFVVMTNRWARSKPELAWPVFVIGAVGFFTLDVLGNYWFNFRVIGEPGRLIPELDMVLILGVVLLLEWSWRMRKLTLRIVAILVVLVAFWSTRGYIRISHKLVPKWLGFTERVEYRIPDWLWTHMPDARSYPSGSVRFWFDTWHDLNQLDGGSAQGLLNPPVHDSQWEITGGTDPRAGILWLQALGVDVMYIPGPTSQEVYHDIHNTERFAALPVLFDDGQGNTLYRVPRRYAARARVVETARIDALTPPASNVDDAALDAYLAVVENGPDAPPSLQRQGTDAMTVKAPVAAGQSVLVQESYDPAWRAFCNGERLPIRKDIMGFMLMDVPPGGDTIQLVFSTPLENQVGRAVTVVSLLLMVGLVWRRKPSKVTG